MLVQWHTGETAEELTPQLQLQLQGNIIVVFIPALVALEVLTLSIQR